MTTPDYFKAETYDTPSLDWQDKGLRSHQRMAARFTQYAEGRSLYVDGMGWHHWDGRRWAADSRGKEAHKLLQQLLRLSWTEAIGDKALEADVRAANTGTGSNSVLDLASRFLTADADEMDADPHLFNVANGTIDLRTLELREHNPADRITKLANAAYVETPDSSRWMDFLNSTLPDTEIQEFLQRFIGSTLIGKVIDHVLVVATGKAGRNGKSTLAKAVAHMMGDYAITASNSMLITGRYKGESAGEKASMMRLRGARFAIMSELEKGAQLAEATMKQLTGGDTIEAKLMGQNPVQFAPSHSFFMLTNDLPKVDPTAQAVWARIRVVPFEQSFEGREDTTLDDDLVLAADSILHWAIAGLWAHQQEGLNAPPKVMAATTDYRAENDSVEQFLSDECVLAPNARVTRSELHHAYLEWARENGAEQLTAREFAPRIASLPGISEAKIRGVRVWRGAGLKNSETRDD